eukprot:910109-Rhodomonas_salina.1
MPGADIPSPAGNTDPTWDLFHKLGFHGLGALRELPARAILEREPEELSGEGCADVDYARFRHFSAYALPTPCPVLRTRTLLPDNAVSIIKDKGLPRAIPSSHSFACDVRH